MHTKLSYGFKVNHRKNKTIGGIILSKHKCPQCGSEDIKKGIIGASLGQVHMFPEHKRGASSPISTNYCNDCGYILSLYVDNPKNLG